MKKIMALLALTAVIFLLPLVNAESGHMKLLAVSETSDGYIGGIADLYLEIKPGSGRVFLETFPLTKVDTQISTRLAKEVACDFADADCSKYDFFYAITADSPIVAGPSAGASIAVLTFSLIKNADIDQNTAITGTINSGGIIGPVGGLRAKIDAASKVGLSKVLIPVGGSFESAENESSDGNESINKTFDINKLSENYGIRVKEIATFDEALFEFTGKKFREKKANLTINQDYKDTMKTLAIQLCSRNTQLRNRVSNLTDNKTKPILENAINLSSKGKEAFGEKKYYSSASYCFGANVELNHLILLQQNLTEKGILGKAEDIRKDIANFDKIVENEGVKTVTDLESYMAIKERLMEANDFLDSAIKSVNNSNINLRDLAYAAERFNSARSWANFLGHKGKKFDFNKETIRNACRTKLSEVEERLQYVQLYLPQNLENIRKDMGYAYQDLNDNNYELCLFKASKAKANVDTILSVFGVKNDDVQNVVSQKLGIVERNLVEEIENGVFPILGYSYFEYANSLKSSDPLSALLYSEYALELSNLDIYFKSPGKKINFPFRVDKRLFVVLITGIALGIIVANIPKFKRAKRNAKRK